MVDGDGEVASFIKAAKGGVGGVGPSLVGSGLGRGGFDLLAVFSN